MAGTFCVRHQTKEHEVLCPLATDRELDAARRQIGMLTADEVDVVVYRHTNDATLAAVLVGLHSAGCKKYVVATSRNHPCGKGLFEPGKNVLFVGLLPMDPETLRECGRFLVIDNSNGFVAFSDTMSRAGLDITHRAYHSRKLRLTEMAWSWLRGGVSQGAPSIITLPPPSVTCPDCVREALVHTVVQ